MRTLLKKYLAAIIILALVLVLVSLAERQGFKTDATRHGHKALDRSNIAETGELNSMTGKKLIILLDGSILPSPVPEGITTTRVAADSILQKKYASLLRQKDKEILLYSDDIRVSAAVWMVLSQTGIANIRILTDDAENETLQY